jgi:hypothetical protein
MPNSTNAPRSAARWPRIPTRNSAICATFADYLAKNNPEDKEKGTFTGDRVHVSEVGSKLVRETILAVMAK